MAAVIFAGSIIMIAGVVVVLALLVGDGKRSVESASADEWGEQ